MPTLAFTEFPSERHSRHSRNPFHAGGRFRGFTGSLPLQPARLLAPCTDQTGTSSLRDFYFQAFNGSVSLSVAGYNYNSDWTPLLAGLSPAGMAASLAARSFATELVKVDAGTCPLRSESDRNIAVPRMNAIAKSGPTTPASGCISCQGTKRQISTTSGGLDRRLARGQSGAAACAFTSPRRSEVEADWVRGHHHDSGRIKIAPHPARISRRSMLATL